MNQKPEKPPVRLIEHSLDGAVIPQRPTDGYINATKLCQKAGKQFNDYHRLGQTQAFLNELNLETGIPVSKLVQIIRGRGDTIQQGTWVYPDVAIQLGQWLSPAFAVQVSRWVREWMMGTVTPYMPVHVQRYLKNREKIPLTHFSMLNEMYITIFATLEHNGVLLPDSMMPDVSTGKLFSVFLRERGIDTDTFPTYEHEFADATRKPVQARLYPVEHLAAFRKYLDEVWLPKKADAYFLKRLPEAIPYLPRTSQLSPPEDGEL